MGRPFLILTIGQISVRVESENKSFLDDLKQYYPHFVDQNPNHIAADIFIEQKILMYSSNISVNTSRDVYTIDGGEFKGEFCLSSRKAKFTMRPEASLFDSFLRVFYSILLTQYEGFLVHAAGLKKDDRAYLFAGPSSSGKTTTASIADGFTVLNDELTLVKREGDVFYLHATPFNGNYDKVIKNNKAPLEGFFFLDKTLKKGFEPVDKMQSLTRLLECVFFFDPNVGPNQKVLDLCHQLVLQSDAHKINILSRKHLGELINEITRECSHT